MCFRLELPKEATSNNPSEKLSNQLGSVRQPITTMLTEHEQAHEQIGEYFEEIKVLCSDYTLPADACGSYNLYYRLLEEFEDDLHVHVHLENNILFPKTLALEKELYDSRQ